ncbi:NADP-dependent D-sorbitol-6-phosphate dehydrogenase-like [Dorcoceras hygrometricum]|uniref:NADP-dependent D-sorbitol-6-phosphate dehydrogenase-like n=1 Tax=Dorcoceras hygrometricum TaxID=472368 RepID=A0A2Z7D590_9LAMI|nr:NADP-dependent D-sorbitol-6-phosphate dehydrogenase-like [Dorcoceras hygrometricum]
MRSVVASHGPGSNPRGNAILLKLSGFTDLRTPSDHRAPHNHRPAASSEPRPVVAASEKRAASALPRRATKRSQRVSSSRAMSGQRSRSRRDTAQYRTTGDDTPSAISLDKPATLAALRAESRIQYLCDPQWFRDTASRGPTTIAAPESQFRTCPSDHGITDSACKNQLVVVSVQYGPFNPYIPIRSTTIGKSRVAKDPIAMHTSWRSNSDIASVTRLSNLFMLWYRVLRRVDSYHALTHIVATILGSIC